MQATNIGITTIEEDCMNAKLISLFVCLMLDLDPVCAQDFWEQTTPLPSSNPVRALTVNSSNGDVFAATIDGVWKSTNKGSTWSTFGNPYPTASVIALFVNNSFLFASGNGGQFRVYRVPVSGGSWTFAGGGMSSNCEVKCFAVNSNGLYAGSSNCGFLRSTNNGDTWTEMNSGLTNIQVFAQTTRGVGEMFVSTVGGGVFRSTNSGSTWSPANNGNSLDLVSITSKAGYVFAGGLNGHIYVSTNNGNNWSDADIGYPDEIVGLAVTSDGTVLAGSFNHGVWKSTFGASWVSNNGGISLSDYPIRSLAVRQGSDEAYVGTINGHVYRHPTIVDVVGTVEHGIPTVSSLRQSFPNPFNPTTTIRYELAAKSIVTLRVYNPLGQEVRTLVSGVEDAGYRSVEWNSTDNYGQPVSSGVYFCRLLAGDFFSTTKMMLLR